MIANARMYSLTPVVTALWRRLLEGLARRSGLPIEIVDHPPPRPIAELWARADKAAVFMCGLPFSLAAPPPVLVAAPVTSHGAATYWTDLIVAADTPFRHLEDTFGRRFALTTPESQSGFGAPLHHLMAFAGNAPLYAEIVAPAVTPMGAIAAVVDGRAEIAALDSYAHALLRRHAPEIAAQVRVVAQTKPTPIPPLVASGSAIAPLARAFADAHMDEELTPLLRELLLLRFVRPEAAAYDVLRRDFEASRRFWLAHPLARTVHPAFAALQSEPVGLQE